MPHLRPLRVSSFRRSVARWPAPVELERVLVILRAPRKRPLIRTLLHRAFSGLTPRIQLNRRQADSLVQIGHKGWNERFFP